MLCTQIVYGRFISIENTLRSKECCIGVASFINLSGGCFAMLLLLALYNNNKIV